MDTSDLLSLATHMAWADAAVWRPTLAHPSAAGDGKLRATLHHTHLVQHLFAQAWRGEGLATREASEFSTLVDLAAWGRDAHQRVLNFLMEAAAAVWAREFREPWTCHFEDRLQAPAAVHTLGESVVRVVMHTAHHRGQACTRLRELGVEPPTVDFIVWLWSGRPAADWPVDAGPGA